jgi:hypothetical protein
VSVGPEGERQDPLPEFAVSLIEIPRECLRRRSLVAAAHAHDDREEMRSCRTRPDAGELKGAAWLIFAELIDNIFSHSRTELDGYAALQVYSKGNRLSVAVCRLRQLL